MGTRVLLAIWFVLTALWGAAAAYFCLLTWPTVPLDLSPGDPETQAAYSRAVLVHAGMYVLLGVIPPAILFLAGRVLARER